jgi:hypothetical protein
MAPWYHNLICGSIPHPSMPKYHANVIVLPWPLVVSWSILTYAHCLWILLFCGSQGSVVKSSNNWPRHTTPFHELTTSIWPLRALVLKNYQMFILHEDTLDDKIFAYYGL